MPNSNHDREMQLAIDATIECAQASRVCASACLNENDVAMLRECIRLNRDCAWICDLTGAFLIAGSLFDTQACQLCADICDACAVECEIHKDMAHCRECAEACRRCAEACRTMAGALA